MKVAVALGLCLVGLGCGRSSSEETGLKGSPEMQDFLAGMGDAARVKASLDKHVAPGVETHDMEMYDLKDPAVTGEERRGAQACYTFDARAGATTRTYVTCWEGGKIATIEDRGMR